MPLPFTSVRTSYSATVPGAIAPASATGRRAACRPVRPGEAGLRPGAARAVQRGAVGRAVRGRGEAQLRAQHASADARRLEAQVALAELVAAQHLERVGGAVVGGLASPGRRVASAVGENVRVDVGAAGVVTRAALLAAERFAAASSARTVYSYVVWAATVVSE